MVKAKRVTGLREAPDLPPLSEEDFVPDLWAGATKPSWSLEESAYYANGKSVAGPIDIHAPSKISRTYVWLTKEHNCERLKKIDDFEGVFFTPGDVMRYLWEAEKYVCLKMWALYTYADQGEICGLLKKGISKKNYIKAANIIKEAFPQATKAGTIRFLMMLPDEIKGGNDLPVFFHMSEEYLKKLLANKISHSKKGRPKDGEVIHLGSYKTYLIDMIKKELGY